jgi:hypothetical protein
MTTVECLPKWCCRIDAAMTDIPKYPHASLSPSAVVTWACMCALKGGGNRPVSPRCPSGPARPRRVGCSWTARTYSWQTIGGVGDGATTGCSTTIQRVLYANENHEAFLLWGLLLVAERKTGRTTASRGSGGTLI